MPDTLCEEITKANPDLLAKGEGNIVKVTENQRFFR
jgi:hypothetical protein